jgi:hypothetical protein
VAAWRRRDEEAAEGDVEEAAEGDASDA